MRNWRRVLHTMVHIVWWLGRGIVAATTQVRPGVGFLLGCVPWLYCPAHALPRALHSRHYIVRSNCSPSDCLNRGKIPSTTSMLAKAGDADQKKPRRTRRRGYNSTQTELWDHTATQHNYAKTLVSCLLLLTQNTPKETRSQERSRGNARWNGFARTHFAEQSNSCPRTV